MINIYMVTAYIFHHSMMLMLVLTVRVMIRIGNASVEGRVSVGDDDR